MILSKMILKSKFKMQTLGVPAHKKFYSNWQNISQPSPLIVLLSSHVYPLVVIPSGQTEGTHVPFRS